MSTVLKMRVIAAAVLIACFTAAAAYALPFALETQAGNNSTLTRHAMPATEPSLQTDSSKLTGENWMSGLSGSLYLHEINIPGTHDACMWDPYTSHVVPKTQYSYAKTQSKNIKEQLNAGIRLFDIRLTNVYYRGSWLALPYKQTWGKEGLYLVHGAFKAMKGDWRYYADQDSGVLQFETVLGWYAEFLRKHPTETIILDVQYESESGDPGKTLARTREKLDKYYTQKNPSTGKPYIYSENGNKAVTTMPQLSDCRGQMVIISSDDLQYGIHYESSRDWNPKTIAGIHFSVENHYEATRGDKVKYLKALMHGGTVNGQKFSDPVPGAMQSIVRSADSAPLTRSIYASTGSNRPPVVTDSPHQDPEEISKTVNPEMYGSDRTLSIPGEHYGWILSDFVTDDTAKTFWKTNFPGDMHYSTVTYTAPASVGYASKAYTVLAGSTITLPSMPFVDESAKEKQRAGYTLIGWKAGDKTYNIGDTVTISSDITLEAQFAMSWKQFQELLAKNPAGTVNMDYDVKGAPYDSALRIPAGKTLTINMNGHTIDRASKAYGCSRVFTVDGSLKLNGPGTVKGGYDGIGAGFLVNGTLETNNVIIEGNRAGKRGGGAYVGDAGSFTMKGGSITKNIAEYGGGVSVGPRAAFAMRGGSITGNNAKVGGAISMLYEGSLVRVRGDVNVTGNFLFPKDKEITASTELITSGEKQNVRLDVRNFITVDGSLTDGARIGVTKIKTDAAGPLKVAYWPNGGRAIANFTSDQANRMIIELEGDEKFAAISDGVKITFDTDGGSAAPASQTVGIGGKVIQPENPTKAKSTFEYWYKATDTSMRRYDFDQAVNGDMTLKAKWKLVNQTVTFNASGGSPVPSQQVEYGSKATKPNDPERAGSTFAGWYIKVPMYGYYGHYEVRPYDFNSPVMKDIELFARWTTDQYDVAFNSNGGSAVSSQQVAYGSKATKPGNPTREGYTFAGWFADEGLRSAYTFNTPVKANTTLYAKWEPVRYTVAFESNGGSAVPAQSVASGDKASEPEDPTRNGCEFTGWFLSNAFAGAPYSFRAPVEKDTVLYAQWDVTVTFDSNGGSSVESQKATMGAQVGRPQDPKRSGHVFDGWYTEDNKAYDFESAVDAPLTLKAHWKEKPANQKVIVFDSNGGTDVEAAFVEAGAQVNKPSDPTKTGCTFDSWYTDAGLTQPYDFSAPVNNDLYLYAKWTVSKHTVSYDVKDGVPVLPDQEVEHGDRAPIPIDLTKEGNLFSGWYKDSACTVPYSFSSPVVEDLILYAKWVPMRYDVIFVSDGDSDVPAQTVESGQAATAPDTPTKDGCDFGGWYTDADFSDGSAYNFSTPVTADTVLYAKWTVTVNFVTGCGTAIGPKQLICGRAVSEPTETLTKDNYTFQGWFVESDAQYTAEEVAELEEAIEADPDLDDCIWIVDGKVRIAYDFDEPVDYGITLYARWTPSTHTVVFDSNGGSDVASIPEVADGGMVSAPTAPTKDGHTFGGWFLDKAYEYPFDFSMPVFDDLTLYAKWNKLTYRVQFNTNCDASVLDQLVVGGEKASKPADLANEGFDFKGWYADPDLNSEFSFNTPITADTVLYARWSENQQESENCTVTFVDEEADGDSKTIATSEVDAGDPVDPPENDPKHDYATFAGWYIELEGELSDDEIAEVENDSELADVIYIVDKKARVPYDFSEPVYKNMTLYAQWDYGDYQVTYIDWGDELFVDIVPAGEKASELTPDELEGYTFDGWFTDEACTKSYDFNAPIKGNVKVYGKWTKKAYTVTFDSNGGSEVSPQSQKVAYEGFAQKPGDPIRERHVFLGWFEDCSSEMSPDELAQEKALIAEEVQSSADNPDFNDALKQYQQHLEQDVLVVDGKVMAKYNPDTDPVYSDKVVYAQWEKIPGGDVGKRYTVGGNVYKITSNAKQTVTLVKAKNAKKVVVPAKVAINDLDYKVTAIGPKAFKSAKKKLKTVVIGKNVKKIGKKAFAGCSKLKKMVVKTKKLTKKGVKGSLKDSSINVVKVKVGKAKANKTYAKKYAKYFKKANSGRRVVVKA